MMTHDDFPAEFDAALADYPSADPDRAFSAEGAGARAMLVAIEPSGAPTWTASFAAPDPGRSALSALLRTPSPTVLCVVERGTAFLGDVRQPDSFTVLSTPGPVVAAESLVTERVLLLLTPWAIAAISPSGVQWVTPRIAIDGLRVDGIAQGWVRGVADPEDDEPRDFAVELSTGQVAGTSSI